MAFHQFGEYLLRLTDVERQQLNLVVAALRVSEYTDNVDNIHFRREYNENLLVHSMTDFFDTVIGLAIASDCISKKTRDMLVRKPVLTSYAPLLAQLFEVVRRHKQLNPRANRWEFGKLMLILQDTQKSSIRSKLGIGSIPLVLPLQTVGDSLSSLGKERTALLTDPELQRFIVQTGTGKAECLKVLLHRYDINHDAAERGLLERCLRSIDDVESLILSNIDSLITLQTALRSEFMLSDDMKQSGSEGNSEDEEEKEEVHGMFLTRSGDTQRRKLFAHDPTLHGSTRDAAHSLDIVRGVNGSMLTHSHQLQCNYVMASLVLWELVQRNIFLLWRAAEKDMLIDGGGNYQFINTGQGYHRMCYSPNSYKIMSECVREAEARMGGIWPGIKVIHVGDRDVPNPLVFIDKYTQIPGLVHPIAQTLKQLKVLFRDLSSTGGEVSAVPTSRASSPGENTPADDALSSTISYPGIPKLLKTNYGTYEELRMMILRDFFRHGFDGSGDDGGSCIDGRLTSAWNWCQNLNKKTYYTAFVLAGFVGFD